MGLCVAAGRRGRCGRAVLGDDWFVFVNLAREPLFWAMRPESVYALVGRRRRLGEVVPVEFTPHWLRHTHATALLLAGVSAHVVMRGWVTPTSRRQSIVRLGD